LERLRIDCQLTEATATGFDPPHLAEVFGISADRNLVRHQRQGAVQSGTSSSRSGFPAKPRLDAASPWAAPLNLR
jgi:hypothetical protein